MTVPTPLRGSNGITFGPDGRLYVAEFLPGRISSVDVATGAVQTVIAPDGPLQAPDDVAFGADGTMYITDLSPGQVWRLGLDGDLTVLAGDLANPNGIAVLGDRVFVNEMTFGGRLLEVTDGVPRVLTEGLTLGNAMQFGPDGNLYYPHMFPGDVYRIAPDGGVPELVAADVPQTVAVRLDRNGVLHVLLIDEAGTIVRIEDGERTTIVTGIPGLDNAAFDADNRMFVSSFAAGGITEVLPGGGTREVVPRGLAGPFDVTVDAGGAVVTADHYRIDGALRPFAHAIAADGDVLHFTSQYGQAGTFDRTSRSARARAENLEQPRGIAVRPDGALIVAEAGRDGSSRSVPQTRCRCWPRAWAGRPGSPSTPTAGCTSPTRSTARSTGSTTANRSRWPRAWTPRRAWPSAAAACSPPRPAAAGSSRSGPRSASSPPSCRSRSPGRSPRTCSATVCPGSRSRSPGWQPARTVPSTWPRPGRARWAASPCDLDARVCVAAPQPWLVPGRPG
ncbi:hypothetical protein [Actinoplanes utahensis]|uniref:hypothetical protein n=1 Tax=Actinoplanes utahensis TaxID=1869 RepID=UPI000AEA873D|nr:hypothetical protein [Actinoplanes utahensis]